MSQTTYDFITKAKQGIIAKKAMTTNKVLESAAKIETLLLCQFHTCD